MGGGTFDWFVSDGGKTHVGRIGSTPKGMLECAKAALEAIDPELTSNPWMIERMDRALRDGADPIEFEYNQEALPKPIAALALKRARQVAHEALEKMQASVGAGFSDINYILVCGGGAVMIRRELDHFIEAPAKRRLIRMDASPVTVNVEGFHRAAEMLLATKIEQAA